MIRRNHHDTARGNTEVNLVTMLLLSLRSSKAVFVHKIYHLFYCQSASWETQCVFQTESLQTGSSWINMSNPAPLKWKIHCALLSRDYLLWRKSRIDKIAAFIYNQELRAVRRDGVKVWRRTLECGGTPAGAEVCGLVRLPFPCSKVHW